MPDKVYRFILAGENQVSEVFDEIDKDANTLASMLGDSWGDIGDGAQSVFDDIRDTAGETFADLQDAADPLANTFDDVRVEAENAFDKIREEGGTAFDRVKDAAGDAFESVKTSARSALGDAASGAKSLFVDAFGELRDVAQDQLKFATKDALEGLGVDPEIAGSIARNVGQLAGTIGDTLSTKAGEFLSGNLAPKLLSAISSSPIAAAIEPVMGAIGTAAGSVMDLAIAAAPLLLPALLIAAIVGAVVLVANDPSIPGKALDVGVGIVRGVLGGLAGLAGGFINFVVGVFHGIWAEGGIAQSVLTFALNIPGTIVSGLVGLAAGLIGFVGDVFGGLWQQGTGIAASVLTFALNIPGGIIAGLLDLGARLLDFIVGQVQGLWNFGGELARTVLDLGGKVVQWVIDGMVNLGRQLASTVGDAIAKLPDFVINIVLHPDLSQLAAIGALLSGNLPAFLASQNARAGGGPVDGGQPYLVGENGPEIFVPGVSGNIIPNDAIASYGGAGSAWSGNGAAGGDTIVQINGPISLPNVTTPREFLRELQDLARQQRVNLSFGEG